MERVWRGNRPRSKFCSHAPPLGRHLAYCPSARHSVQIHTNHTYGKDSKRGISIMPQAQLKKSKTGPKTPAKPYVNSSTTDRRAQATSTDTPFVFCRSQRIQTGNKVIKPKKAVLVRAQTIHKKHTAGLQAVTEKTLAGRAGHLELLRGGKKDRKQSIPGKPTGGVKPKEDKTG